MISSENPAEVDAFYQESTIDSTVLLFPEDYRSITARSRTTHPDPGVSYWMSVRNEVDYTRPCYELTGITNLPAGESLTYSFLDPSTGVQGLYRGRIVVPGKNPEINRCIILKITLYPSFQMGLLIGIGKQNLSEMLPITGSFQKNQ